VVERGGKRKRKDQVSDAVEQNVRLELFVVGESKRPQAEGKEKIQERCKNTPA